MADRLVALLCGRLCNKTLRLPSIPFEIVPDIRHLAVIIRKYVATTRFIILYYDQLDTTSAAILHPWSTQPNIDVIVLGGNALNNLPPNQINRLRISEDLATYKTAIYGIRAYQLIAKQYHASNETRLGAFFEDEAKKLLAWLIDNFRLKSCHILLIPLNTDEENLRQCQDALMERCKMWWPNTEIRVCTIDDYHLFEEDHLHIDDPSTDISARFTRYDREMILNLIKHLAPIRLYLIGRESSIRNSYSRSLVARERNIAENSAKRFIDGCSFVEYELVGEAIKRDLPGHLGARWQMTGSQIKLKSLDELFIDDFFRNAVGMIDDTLTKRDIDAALSIWQKNLQYRECNSDYSEQLHMVDQAQTSRADPNDNHGELMDISMQRNFTT